MKAIKISYWNEVTGQLQEYECGINCVSIAEHQACDEGDRWYYDIELINDKILRVFVFGSVNVLYEK